MGEVAPFSLLAYQDARSHAKQIAAATAGRFMPPWEPEPGYGTFENDRRLSEQEIRILQEWTAAGASEGDANDLPVPPKFPGGWQLGEPDLVLNMATAYEVQGNSPESYRCFAIPTGLSSDRYIRAIEVRPEMPGVIHHAIVVQDAQHAGRRLAGETGNGYSCGGGFGFAMAGILTMWTAGTVAHTDPEGIATMLKKNADLVVQLHLRPRTEAARARVRVGLYFSNRPPKHTPIELSVSSYDIDVPAGKADYRVTAFSYIPVDVDAYSIFAHAHYLAKRFKVLPTLPTGEVKPLLFIKNLNFDWQENYWFKTPLRLPQGTRLDVEVIYDNSVRNARNPSSPPRRVTWGFLTSDEMCEVHVRAVFVDSSADLSMDGMH